MEEEDSRVRMFNAMMAGGLSPMEAVRQEQERNALEQGPSASRSPAAPTASAPPQREQTLQERMQNIVKTSGTIKKHTDKGEMPHGLAEYANQKGMTEEEVAELLAFNERIATGAIKIDMHGDGQGFNLSFGGN